MGYASKRGRRPAEYASKSAHSGVVKDTAVQSFLSSCNPPKRASDVDLSEHKRVRYQPVLDNPIYHFIAVDGGYTEVAVQPEFPSATICFFQFGALIFSLEDLESVEAVRFIDPEDMAKLKHIQRLKLTLPIRNISLKSQNNLTDSVRWTIYDFFSKNPDDSKLMETLKWFLFEEYGQGKSEYVLANCPSCLQSRIPLRLAEITSEFTFRCGSCGAMIYLTDVFRLHEAIDNEIGAGGILAYVMTTFEQLVIVHLIHLILKTKPDLLSHVLFIKDGPLAFFGQTANMHTPMRRLVQFLFQHHNLYLAGLEKSGAFVEHADEMASRLEPGGILILDNEYIYRYIIPGKADPTSPYGRTTYYGNKIIFKTMSGAMYVVSLPTPTDEVIASPTEGDLPNLQIILSNIEKLRCDMYDNSLVPIALANKLVSLANHPSSKILQKFAIETVGR
jgi:hypothetical protein